MYSSSKDNRVELALYDPYISSLTCHDGTLSRYPFISFVQPFPFVKHLYQLPYSQLICDACIYTYLMWVEVIFFSGLLFVVLYICTQERASKYGV